MSFDPNYDGNKALSRVFHALRDSEIYNAKHTAEPTGDGQLLHTLTWVQRPSPAGT